LVALSAFGRGSRTGVLLLHCKFYAVISLPGSITDVELGAPRMVCRKLTWARLRLQQQFSLLSQANWGKLEMKPTRNKERRITKHKNIKAQKKKGRSCLMHINCKSPSTSIHNSLGMSHSLRSLLTASSQVSLGRPLPLLHYRPGLAPHYAPVSREASCGHDQTIPTGVGPIFPQLVPLQLYPECLHFGLYLF
jgi:hypothetical protein